MDQQLTQAIKHWHAVAPLLQPAKTHKKFEEQVKQLDALLAIIGSNGKRQLNLRQIKLFSQYFSVTPATFIDENL